jgi:tetratricopeptide (TPR) repeat protein
MTRLAKQMALVAATVCTCVAAPGMSGLSRARVEATHVISPSVFQDLNPTGGTDLERARHLVDLGQFAAADAVLDAALQHHELTPEGHYLLAYTLLRQNKPKDALREYTAAAQLQPPDANDLRNVANAYAVLDDIPDAEKWMTRSVQMDATDPNGWYGLGRIYLTQQRFSDAAACFQKTLALDPQSVKAEDNLGLSLEELNRADDAIQAYRSAIALVDKYPHSNGGVLLEQPFLNLAIVLMHRNENDEALVLLQRATKLAPSNAKVHQQLGHLYLSRNWLEDAEKELLVASSLAPNDASMHFFLGQVYRREGHVEQAAKEFALSSKLLGTHSSPSP